ncbi:fumarylacetoacetate hydrolase family protein [Amycolatopsis viridis]|uniref:Acylpyruvate hydrolase n=1 Tax=Amycolatopsis viridis TaxID=185678 RepID=A0ABX0SPK3_9PSEU|nr:fumarylacetoacetate hydrolase family protein [Amycolatopsis viridis]NIH78887.1 acylpyruvate hydrolase [Amycolatopsis viridis]
MKYASYQIEGSARVGVVEGDTIVPLGDATLTVNAGVDALQAAPRHEARRIPLAQVRLLPASPAPKKIFCVGLNYLDHVQETKRELPRYPVLFPKFASNLIAAGAPIQLPPESRQVDWEGELAVIIGRPGRRIARAEALDHVLGYSIANDITVRDYQYKTHQWLQGKAWDGSTPLGPWIVTPDQVDLTTAGIRTILNDEVVQESTLSKLIFDVPRLVSELSEFTALEPGDVILTGTPGGVGYRRDPQVFLKNGDEIRVEIDGIGRITSTVVDEVAAGERPASVG